MGGFTKNLESVLKGLALAATVGIASFSSSDSFAQQQKQAQPAKQEQKQEKKIQEAPKDNEPDEATQNFRMDQIKKLLAEDYKKKDVASKSALADKLAEGAANPNNDAALRFVYWREAMRASAEALDLSRAFEFTERLSESYTTNGLRHKCEAFNIARKLVKDADQATSIAESGHELTGELYIKGDFSSALKIAADSKGLPKLPKDNSQRLTDLESEIKQVDAAEKTLSAMPDDAKANTTVARYTAFRRGKLDEAKEYAKKGNDPVLIDLIDADSTNPDTSESQFLLGKQYFEASKKLKGFEKDEYVMRANFYLTSAKPRANALMQGDIDKMLKEMQPAAPVGKGTLVDLLKMVDPAKDAVAGKWTIDNKGNLISDASDFARIQFKYEPPEEYDLSLTFSRKQGNLDVASLLSSESNGFSFNLSGGDGSLSGFFSKIYNKPDNPTVVKKGISNSNTHTLQVKVRKESTGYSAKSFLDNVLLTEWKYSVKDLGANQYWTVKNEKAIGIGSHRNVTEFYKIVLTEINGKGKRIQ